MADGNITVEVNTKAAQAELERLRAENAALKHDLQYARDGLIRGRTRMREDNERLRAALEAVLAWGTDETYERAKAACDTARALLGPNAEFTGPKGSGAMQG